MGETKHLVCPHCGRTNRVPQERMTEEPQCGACHQALLDGRPLELTESNIQRHVEHSDLPVLVDFRAPWCGSCRSMAPVFSAAAAGAQDRALRCHTENIRHWRRVATSASRP